MADPSDIAHLLRRTSFSVSQQKVDELAQLSWEDAIRVVVDNAAPPNAGSLAFKNVYMTSDGDDFAALLDYELNRLSRPQSGLGDKMLWFWHGLITSSISKVELSALMFRQHDLLARHALGNLRSMLYDITVDCSMLIYLDGDGSSGDAPNENYAREVMELFTLGRGNYDQNDVRAGARALAGWYIDGFPQNEGDHFDQSKIVSLFDPNSAFSGDVNYLGAGIHLDGSISQYKLIVDQILNLRSEGGLSVCAQHTASKLYEYFVHPLPDPNTVATLAGIFQDSNFEIRPLLSALFRHPDFTSQSARRSRARLPMETLLAAAASLDTPIDGIDYGGYLDATGQIPFDPPNVAGWTPDNRWLSASQSIARARLALLAFDLSKKNSSIASILNANKPVKQTLRLTALTDASQRTIDQLNQTASFKTDPKTWARILLSLAILSPDFALA